MGDVESPTTSLQRGKTSLNMSPVAQLPEVVEYTDYITAEG